MKEIICIILIIGLFSCKERKSQIENIETENLTQKKIDSILNKFEFKYENPIVLDSTNQILFPISTKLLKRKETYSKDGYYEYDLPRYWNILFFNRNTGKTKLLTNKRFRISEINTKKDKNNTYYQQKLLEDKIIYKINDIDYNKDNKLNSKDPEFLFISEIDGSNLQRISPLNEDLIYYEVIEETDELLFQTRRDTNKDFIFSESDESIWYKSKMIANEWVKTEIIDSINKAKIEKLYFNQWLRKE